MSKLKSKVKCPECGATEVRKRISKGKSGVVTNLCHALDFICGACLMKTAEVG
jgi:endogenous inhibitor of DNA gyrase (YacG/DUF329 family)